MIESEDSRRSYIFNGPFAQFEQLIPKRVLIKLLLSRIAEENSVHHEF
jgi:hypothetical protein